MNDRYANYKGMLGLAAIIVLIAGAALFASTVPVAPGSNAAIGSAKSREDSYVREPLPTAEEIAKLPPDGGAEFNRLIFETSPYLLQHARNPVDWRPWSPETLDLAKSEGKPIFMSVGYSTCHWCHVMARESFVADDVAEILNAYYIPVKVDREELPDVDATYMTATQLLTGSGGWPNSVWMTPEGKPFFARTYVPRSEFKQILLQLKNAFEQRNSEIEDIASQVMSAIEQAHALDEAAANYDPSADDLQRIIDQSQTMFDSHHGGLGSAPKFPPHGFLSVLAYELHRRPDNAEALRMFTLTLDKMAAGGIHDHLGGGFHRYSTDHLWLLPHFEKMLYDNAQLARTYTDAWLLTGEKRYREVAESTCDWILREMTDPSGGFYSAQDAESEAVEGKSYVWTKAEVQEVLGRSDGELFARVYGFTDEGNFIEESSGERTGANVIYLPRPLAETAEQEGLAVDKLEERLARMREQLLEARLLRPQPHTDDKVLTNWNGMAIGALAYVGKALGREEYVAAAERAAQFALSELRGADGLMHTWRVGEARVEGHSDDYAFLADGLLELHIATGSDSWLDVAKQLVDDMFQRFSDEDGSLFYTTASADTSLLRRKDGIDDVIPSGNGMAARVLARLFALTGDESYDRQARALLVALSGTMEAQRIRTESLHLGAAMLAERQATPGRPQVQLRARSSDGPVAVVAHLEDSASPGGSVDLIVELQIEGEYHVNALAGHSVRPQDLILTSIELKGPAWATIDDRLTAPEPVMLSFPGYSEKLPAYEGTVRFVQPLKVPGSVSPGNYDLLVGVQAQPCDDRACLLPQTHELPLTLVIE